MALTNTSLHILEERLNETIVASKQLTGGDINRVFLVETISRKIVVKQNSATAFSQMLAKEFEGLIQL